MGLAVVRDLREVRAPACAEEIERFETDVVAGYVRTTAIWSRCAAGLVGRCGTWRLGVRTPTSVRCCVRRRARGWRVRRR